MKEYTVAKYAKELAITSVPLRGQDGAVADTVDLKVVWKSSA